MTLESAVMANINVVTKKKAKTKKLGGRKILKNKKEKNEAIGKCLRVGRFEIERQRERKGGNFFLRGTMAP
jgi:hypothetical protein